MSNTKIVKEIISVIQKLEYVSDNTVIKNITFSPLSNYDEICDWTVQHLKEKYRLVKDYLLNVFFDKPTKKCSTDKQIRVKLILNLLEAGYDTPTIQQKLNTDHNIYISENSINKIKSEIIRLLASLLFQNN